MTQALPSRDISCPYCGEIINILIDYSITQQNYVEDCQVCCRPMIIDIAIEHDGNITVQISHEND